MGCNQTLAGLLHDCLPSMGGIKAVYLANFDSVASVTLTDGVITALTLADAEHDPTPFFKYELPDGVGSLEITPTIDRATGANYVESVLSLTFPRMTTAKRAEMEALKLNDLIAVVEDNNGVWWWLGYDRPVIAGGTPTSGTGAAFSDTNRYAIELHDISLAYPYTMAVGSGIGELNFSNYVGN